jgi:selenocysteine lyase/cysteine desulfurase
LIRPDPKLRGGITASWSFTPGLNEEKIHVWDGNYYALEVTTRLGLEDSGGMVRVGPVHYNTVEEFRRFGEVLREIAGKVG